jgi:hypothetical protein
MPESTPAVAVRPFHAKPSKPLGPGHLKVVEVFKPTTRAPGARTTERDATLPTGVLSAPRDGMDGGWE